MKLLGDPLKLLRHLETPSNSFKIPWNSFRTPWNHLENPWNSLGHPMKLAPSISPWYPHKFKTFEITWNSFRTLENPWNSKDTSWNPYGNPMKLLGVPLKLLRHLAIPSNSFEIPWNSFITPWNYLGTTPWKYLFVHHSTQIETDNYVESSCIVFYSPVGFKGFSSVRFDKELADILRNKEKVSNYKLSSLI